MKKLTLNLNIKWIIFFGWSSTRKGSSILLQVISPSDPPLDYLNNMDKTSDLNNCYARGPWEEMCRKFTLILTSRAIENEGNEIRCKRMIKSNGLENNKSARICSFKSGGKTTIMCERLGNIM